MKNDTNPRYPVTNTSNNKKYVVWNTGICPIASKVGHRGHVTLATPPLGSFIVPYVVHALPWSIQQRETRRMATANKTCVSGKN